jgi:lysophospholipase L1-like esterase
MIRRDPSRRALACIVVALLGAALVAAACGPDRRVSAAERPPTPVTSVTAEPTTTTTTVPVAPPKKVLVMGDSVIWDAVPRVREGFGAAGIEVVSEAFPGTSLLGGTNVRQTFRQVVTDHRPDVVVLGYTGVYLPPYAVDDLGRPIELSSEAYWTAWTVAAAEATATFGSLGARVYWVLYPHDEITWAAQEMRMNDLYRGLRAWYPGVRFIDWRAPVSGPFGAPVDSLPLGPNGEIVPVRGPDGHHFSPDGTRTLADHLVDTVLRDHHLR